LLLNRANVAFFLTVFFAGLLLSSKAEAEDACAEKALKHNPRILVFTVSKDRQLFLNFARHMEPADKRKLASLLAAGKDFGEERAWLATLPSKYREQLSETGRDLADLTRIIGKARFRVRYWAMEYPPEAMNAQILAPHMYQSRLLEEFEKAGISRPVAESFLPFSFEKGVIWSKRHLKDAIDVALVGFEDPALNEAARETFRKLDEGYELFRQDEQRVEPEIPNDVRAELNQQIERLEPATFETFEELAKGAEAFAKSLEATEKVPETHRQKVADFLRNRIELIRLRLERDRAIARNIFALDGNAIATIGEAHRSGVLQILRELCTPQQL
jgi:hypothetical protein